MHVFNRFLWLPNGIIYVVYDLVVFRSIRAQFLKMEPFRQTGEDILRADEWRQTNASVIENRVRAQNLKWLCSVFVVCPSSVFWHRISEAQNKKRFICVLDSFLFRYRSDTQLFLAIFGATVGFAAWSGADHNRSLCLAVCVSVASQYGVLFSPSEPSELALCNF